MAEHLHPAAKAIIQGPEAHISEPAAYNPEFAIGFKT